MNYQEEGSISMPMVVYLDGEEKYRAMRYDPEKQSQAFFDLEKFLRVAKRPETINLEEEYEVSP